MLTDTELKALDATAISSGLFSDYCGCNGDSLLHLESDRSFLAETMLVKLGANNLEEFHPEALENFLKTTGPRANIFKKLYPNFDPSSGNFQQACTGLNLEQFKKLCIENRMLESLLSGLKGDSKTIVSQSAITTLKTPLMEQRSKDQVTISTHDARERVQDALGKHKLTISTGKLQRLASTVQTVCVAEKMPPQLYHKIVTELAGKDILKVQEKRSLKEILNTQGTQNYADWKSMYKNLGCTSEEHFMEIADTSLQLLASNVCQSQEILSLIKQRKINDSAMCEMKSGNMDTQQSMVLASTTGINFKYGLGCKFDLKKKDDLIKLKSYITNMWRGVLQSAKNQGCRVLVLPPIGLGVFVASMPEDDKKQVAEMYQSCLFNVSKEYEDQVDRIYINPGQFSEQLNSVSSSDENQQQTMIKTFNGDTFYLGEEIAQKYPHIKPMILNPSDEDVTWQEYDPGEYYRTLCGSFVGEEFIGAHSTAVLGSVGINPFLNSPDHLYGCFTGEAQQQHAAEQSLATWKTKYQQEHSVKTSTEIASKTKLHFEAYREQWFKGGVSGFFARHGFHGSNGSLRADKLVKSLMVLRQDQIKDAQEIFKTVFASSEGKKYPYSLKTLLFDAIKNNSAMTVLLKIEPATTLDDFISSCQTHIARPAVGSI